jgi:TolA-binding protein
MIRQIIGIVTVVVLCAGPVLSEEQQESGLRAWLRSMHKKLDIVNPRKTMPVSTGVAGVRGAKQDEKAKLYWKGEQHEEQVTEAELAEFKEAVALADKGDTAGAARELEEFMRQYPDSELIPDAKRTLDLVKAEPKREQMPAPEAESAK